MKQISAYSLSGYQHGMGSFGKVHVENEDCPPVSMIFFVFAVAMSGGIFFADRLDSIALGWIAGVAILAMVGALIDKFFTGANALERRIAHRQRARRGALNLAPSNDDLKRQWQMWNASTTREWTSTSAYRRHPQSTTTARAGWFPDNTHRGSRAEYRIRRA
jgi:hypothetical protein